MAFAEHLRLVMAGRLTSELQPEIWQCTVNLVPNAGAPALFDCSAYLEAVAPNIQAWFISANAANSALATLDYLKCNAIGPDGKYQNAADSNTYDYSPTRNGTGGDVHPDILCTCVSWTTAKKRGPGAHGRIYPPNQYGDTEHMTISIADQEKALTAGQALLSAIVDTATGDLGVTPVVASAVNATNTPITGVSIGSVLDVQRRRKDNLIEKYVSGSWPP